MKTPENSNESGRAKLIVKEKLELDNDIFEGQDERRGRPEYFMPPGTEVLRVFDYMEIDLGRGSKEKEGRIELAIFSVIWNAIAGIIFFGAIGSAAFPFLAIMSVFVIVGIYTLALVLKKYINSKKVFIRNGMITVKEGPIRIGSLHVEIPTEDIEQLYISKYFTGIKLNEKKVMAYSLSAITKDHKSIRLIDGSNLETVQYLEQEVERFLDITDKHVKGEIL